MFVTKFDFIRIMIIFKNITMTKNFFKNDKERILWIRLNAERIQYSQRIINGVNQPLGEIGERHSCMQISLNQLEYDENNRDMLRFSFKELLTLTPQQLLQLSREKNEKKIKEMFEDKY